jgi:hypothetical protein
MLSCLRRGDTAAARILSQDLETLKTKAERRLAKLHQRSGTEAAQKHAVARVKGVGVGGKGAGRGDAGAGGDAAAPSMAAAAAGYGSGGEEAATESQDSEDMRTSDSSVNYLEFLRQLEEEIARQRAETEAGRACLGRNTSRLRPHTLVA